ncbi:protein translocase subunit SecD [Mumia sp. zg.B53]|uniref:protein translocase subunit SecD n=1 Tax=unclassified Mumia TaxID=2621872 RepID=UPI001C6ED6D8|nr:MULTISPECIES: protein translocase subunit SecD [unclassified Mumia]MBW9206127.1 protein translocase subunit SecD [Mumia sp. zg.B17]MBW9211581.1 protein translocase subunit SecD [Mumia sp. zg.B21]MBW9216752.1 protein translocase subunit SecD [Mumia sp. zg.B53]
MSRPDSRAPLWRALAALTVLVISAVVALNFTPRLGLDLKGGTQIVLETQDTERVKADGEATDRALEVLRGRVDALGVAEPTLARSGENRIIVELPGVQDPREAAEVIGQTAQLTFHNVIGPAQEGAKPAEGQQIVEDEDGNPIIVGPQLLDGNGVSSAKAEQEQQSLQWVVNVRFNGEGTPGWKQLVNEACANTAGGQRIAIMLDKNVISSPAVQPSLCAGPGSTTSITGDFSADSAKDLAVLIEGGALPVPVEVIEQRTVGATLGDSAIEASIEAALIGVALTAVFIMLVYRLMGFLASIALGTYALLSYAMLVWLGATLTLPGLAGFVLAIGLAIDANVLVFERAREEYARRTGEGLPRALDTGYKKAWTAILDSNVTTIIAAGLLFFFASGPVKGFGVTLTIGTIASMVSALVIARVLTDWAVRRSFAQKRPGITGLTGTGKFRTWLVTKGPFILKRSGLLVGLTLAAIAVAVTGVVTQGLNLGVEFTGGRVLDYKVSKPITTDAARTVVSDAGFPSAVVQESGGESGDQNNITVRTDKITDDEAVKIEDALDEAAGPVTKERDELIGPSLGKELRNQAIIAFIIALAAQMLYLSIRFRWTFATAAVLALATTVALVVGIFAWFGEPVDGVFLAAILSIIGLDVNDTVVVFDRIRENLRERKKGDSLRRIFNDSIMQTVPRTVNTGLGAIFILAALAILGGASLQPFAIALLLGLTLGTLGTVFVASPIAVLLEERFQPKDKADRVAAADPYATVPAGGRESGAL